MTIRDIYIEGKRERHMDIEEPITDRASSELCHVSKVKTSVGSCCILTKAH